MRHNGFGSRKPFAMTIVIPNLTFVQQKVVQMSPIGLMSTMMAAIGTLRGMRQDVQTLVVSMKDYFLEQLEKLAATVVEVTVAVPDETSQDEFLSDEMQLMVATFWKD